MKITYFFAFIIIFFTIEAFAEQIIFESATRYKKNSDAQFSDLKAGDTLELGTGDSALTISQQGLPLLIFSAQNKGNSITVKNSDFSQLVSDSAQPLLNKNIDEILSGLRKSENLIKKRDYQQALITVSPLKEKYKNISAVLFMTGTVNFLLNNKNEAIADLEKGLLIDPNDASAKGLLEKLKGGSR